MAIAITERHRGYLRKFIAYARMRKLLSNYQKFLEKLKNKEQRILLDYLQIDSKVQCCFLLCIDLTKESP